MKNYKKIIIGVILIWIIVFVTRVIIVVDDITTPTVGSYESYGYPRVDAFNDKFTQYEGSMVRGSRVNALMKTVMQSNMQSREEGLIPGEDAKFVSINGNAGISLNIHDTRLDNIQQADTSKTYNVKVEYDNECRYVSNIIVDENE